MFIYIDFNNADDFAYNVLYLVQCFQIFRMLPAKHIDKIAEQMQKYNINALLVIGGFEVCLPAWALCIYIFYL